MDKTEEAARIEMISTTLNPFLRAVLGRRANLNEKESIEYNVAKKGEKRRFK